MNPRLLIIVRFGVIRLDTDRFVVFRDGRGQAAGVVRQSDSEIEMRLCKIGIDSQRGLDFVNRVGCDFLRA
jgi:hypothetical protein